MRPFIVMRRSCAHEEDKTMGSWRDARKKGPCATSHSGEQADSPLASSSKGSKKLGGVMLGNRSHSRIRRAYLISGHLGSLLSLRQ